MTQSASLPLRHVLAFAAIGIPMAAIGLPFAVYLPRFYAGELGLGLEVTGTVFMLLRFWDIATDPMMGYLVDRWPSRWGRVKHWLSLSVPVLMISAFFLYMPGDGPVTAGYLIGWLIVFFVGFTLLQTPHQAWVPILARTYDERSRLFQWREIFSTAALLSLLILPDALARLAGFGQAQQIMVMGIILMIALPLTIGPALIIVPDSAKSQSANGRADFSFGAVKSALSNAALWRLLMMEICIGMAIAGTAATYLFAAEWGFGVVEGAGVILMAFFVAGFCAIPFWMFVARKTQKHTALSLLSALAALAYLSYLPLSSLKGFYPLLAGAIVSGLAFGSPFILLRSMMADLVERELARSGEDRAGLYYSFLTSAYKTGASLAVGIPFLLLGAVVGFNASGDNSPEAVRGLMLTFIGVPATSYVIVALLAWGYPVTREMQAKISAQLAERRAE